MSNARVNLPDELRESSILNYADRDFVVQMKSELLEKTDETMAEKLWIIKNQTFQIFYRMEAKAFAMQDVFALEKLYKYIYVIYDVLKDAAIKNVGYLQNPMLMDAEFFSALGYLAGRITVKNILEIWPLTIESDVPGTLPIVNFPQKFPDAYKPYFHLLLKQLKETYFWYQEIAQWNAKRQGMLELFPIEMRAQYLRGSDFHNLLSLQAFHHQILSNLLFHRDFLKTDLKFFEQRLEDLQKLKMMCEAHGMLTREINAELSFYVGKTKEWLSIGLKRCEESRMIAVAASSYVRSTAWNWASNVLFFTQAGESNQVETMDPEPIPNPSHLRM